MSKEHQHDQWLVNGSPIFGTIPGGLIGACPEPKPIHLFRGTNDWGWTHICNKHGQQRLFHFENSVEEMIWRKCADRGDIHQSIDPDGLTISITVAPTAFIVLKYQAQFDGFSITTMYSKRKQTPLPKLGDYAGFVAADGRPIFAIVPHTQE
jgi:hypothetical protein